MMTFKKYLFAVIVVCMPFSLFAETATFAGGCYWCMEALFDHTDGVISAVSGFEGDQPNQPATIDAGSSKTGLIESVQVEFDPQKISYEKLLDLYWKNIDPTDKSGQFCDRGGQYQSVIFYHDAQQKALAEKSKQEMESRLNRKLVTPIVPTAKFSPVEEKEQDFWKKNAFRYKQYRSQCGRDRRLRELWGSDTKEE